MAGPKKYRDAISVTQRRFQGTSIGIAAGRVGPAASLSRAAFLFYA
jgi:hypothetical protein